MQRLFLIGVLLQVCFAQNSIYPWSQNRNEQSDRISGIKCLNSFVRSQSDSDSFEFWLRNLPLKPAGEKVKLFNGQFKSNQNAHFRIIDIDIGKKDLQQCADAIIRLRAEFLFYRKQYNKIHFNFTSGDSAKYSDWINGLRPIVTNNHVKWKQTAQAGNTYSIFRKYLETIFIYSGSYSLRKELTPVANVNDIQIGDIFIQSGFPGHAVLVVDKSVNQNGQIAVLLAQSYMPAQDIHILRNLNDNDKNPWYMVHKSEKLITPEWTFEWTDLHRFKP